MATAHQSRIERNDIKKRSEAELLPQEFAHHPSLRPAQGRVEEKLARIIARLAMDIDRPSVIGGLLVIEPEWIRKPGTGLGQGDEVAGAKMVQPDLRPIGPGINALDA